MLRTAFQLFAFLAISCTTTSAFSAEPHQEWWKYLKGSWTYEFSPIDIKGEATWRLAAKGNAIVGRFSRDDGSAVPGEAKNAVFCRVGIC